MLALIVLVGCGDDGPPDAPTAVRDTTVTTAREPNEEYERCMSRLSDAFEALTNALPDVESAGQAIIDAQAEFGTESAEASIFRRGAVVARDVMLKEGRAAGRSAALDLARKLCVVEYGPP